MKAYAFSTVLLILFFSGNLWSQKQLPKYSSFIENRGQITNTNNKPATNVLFKTSTPFLDCYITTTGITYAFISPEKEEHEEASENDEQNSLLPTAQKHNFFQRKNSDEDRQVRMDIVELELKGAVLSASNCTKLNPSEQRYNYFLPVCTDGIYGVQEFRKIVFKNIYPGIDWVLYGVGEKGLKYDFIVHPGADYRQIELCYKAKNKTQLTETGNLNVKVGNYALEEKAPFSYFSKSKQPITSAFHLKKTEKKQNAYECSFGFETAAFSVTNDTLIIDPQLTWYTLFGGNNFDGATVLETDTTGNLFVAGYTYSNNFPLVNNNTYFVNVYSTVTTIILKFNSNGILLWSTYYGGSGGPNNQSYNPKGMAIDKFGNLFLLGTTSYSNFPVQNAGSYFQGTLNVLATCDLFILKFDNNGTRLWATLFGGSGEDFDADLDVDTSGNIYVVSKTFSNNFPVLNGGGYFQPTYFATNAGIATISKFTNAGNLLWSTYFGNYLSIITGVKCDNIGNVVVAGFCVGAGVPTVNPGAGVYFQSTPNPTTATSQCFISKFNSQTNLVWSTLYGDPNGTQRANGVGIDSQNNIFILGASTSSLFPLQNSPGAYFQTATSNASRAFILKFNNVGVRQWATFCANSVSTEFRATHCFAFDTCNDDVYLAFTTNTGTLAAVAACDGGFLQTTHYTQSTSVSRDAVLLKFSNTGALRWSTFFGGSGDDFCTGITIDKYSRLYMTGEAMAFAVPYSIGTYSFVNPGNSTYFNNLPFGSDDSFIARFGPITFTTAPTYAPCCANSGTLAPGTLGNLPPGGVFYGSPGLVIDSLSGVVTPSAAAAGIYTVTYVTPACSCSPTLAFITTVTIQAMPQQLSVSGPTAICSGQNATLTATALQPASTNYTWLPGSQTSSAVILSPTSSITYTLLASMGNSCTSSLTLPIVVSASPTLVTTGNGTVCQGQTISIQVSGANSYTWSAGQTGSSINIMPQNSGTVTVIGQAANNCTSAAQHTITVLAAPSVTLNGPTTICIGESFNYTISGAQNYLWSAGQTSSILPVSIKSSTVLSCISTGTNGCTTTSNFSINVAPCLSIGDYAKQNKDVEVSPNPSSGEITIRSQIAADFTLYDEVGRLIHEFNLKAKDYKILQLSKGAYVLRWSRNTQLFFEKIVVQ